MRELALNGYSPTGKALVCILWRKCEIFEGGEREANLLVHALSVRREEVNIVAGRGAQRTRQNESAARRRTK